MKNILLPLLATLAGVLQSRAVLHLGILALRQQLATVTARHRKRLGLRRRERLFTVVGAHYLSGDPGPHSTALSGC